MGFEQVQLPPSLETGSEWLLEHEAWGLSLCLPLSLCPGPGDPAILVECPQVDSQCALRSWAWKPGLCICEATSPS